MLILFILSNSVISSVSVVVSAGYRPALLE